MGAPTRNGANDMGVFEREELSKKLYDISLRTLEDTPDKAVTFLRTAGTNLGIFAKLQTRGYSKLIHRQGWRYVEATANIGIVVDESPELAPEVIAAIADLDDLDDEWYKILTVSWKYDYREQLEHVVGNRKPARSGASVVNMGAFAGGLNDLESSPEREATRDADKAALELVAPRGMGPKERAMVNELLERAMSAPQARPLTPEQEEAADLAYVQALGDLRKWYEVWSTIARLVIKRRDRLIQLGLAHRKASEADESAAGTVEEGTGTIPTRWGEQ